jgi:hypothetical protein
VAGPSQNIGYIGRTRCHSLNHTTVVGRVSYAICTNDVCSIQYCGEARAEAGEGGGGLQRSTIVTLFMKKSL